VQSRAGRLDLDPVWALTLDAAKRKDSRCVPNSAFEYFFPARQVALPVFLRDTFPWLTLAAYPAKVMASIASRATITLNFRKHSPS